MSRTRSFAQVDGFAEEAFRGNPVAVILDADGLSDAEMRRIARWTNLSETTFVLPPTTGGADYRVRIFTPAEELPFAGHPTIGTCHAVIEAGIVSPRDEFVQECGIGPVRVRRIGGRLAFAAPPLVRSGPVEPGRVARFAAQLGVDPSDVVDAAWVDNGPGWAALLLASADAVLAAAPGPIEEKLGLVGPHRPGTGAAIEVRAFFTVDGTTREDPVTGSLNASLAQWLLGSGRLSAPYVAAQGMALGRMGRVHVDQDPDGTIWIGGGTRTCVSGMISA